MHVPSYCCSRIKPWARRPAIQLQVKTILNQIQPQAGFVFQDIRLGSRRGQAERIEITVRGHAGRARRCSRCQQPAPGYDQLAEREWRHVPWWGIAVWWRYAPQAEAIEKEACEILGLKELRDYFRKPGDGGFWSDHIPRYSKSRRKAPIYWLLQSSKKSYALWLYYHRFDKDLLFKALVNYVEPKIKRETNRLDEMRRQKQAAGESAREAKKARQGHRAAGKPDLRTAGF